MTKSEKDIHLRISKQYLEFKEFGKKTKKNVKKCDTLKFSFD